MAMSRDTCACDKHLQTHEYLRKLATSEITSNDAIILILGFRVSHDGFS